MKEPKIGEYLAPEAGVVEICLSGSLLIAGSGNEGLLGGSNSYYDSDFD